MNVLGMGPMEIILIVVLALIVFGPAKLPEIMGQVGKAINDFRKATSELSDEFNRTIQAELKETRSAVEETKAVVTEAHTSVTSAISGVPASTRTAAPTDTAPVPAPNGSDPEVANNGAVPGPSTPPLADTSQWSWETAAPAAPKTAEVQAAGGSLPGPAAIETDAPAAASEAPSTTVAHVTSTAEPATGETNVVAGDLAPSASSAAAPQTPRPPSTAAKPAAKRAARDELLPPY
jgi:sec-independent protein translocase protein TatB